MRRHHELISHKLEWTLFYCYYFHSTEWCIFTIQWHHGLCNSIYHKIVTNAGEKIIKYLRLSADKSPSLRAGRKRWPGHVRPPEDNQQESYEWKYYRQRYSSFSDTNTDKNCICHTNITDIFTSLNHTTQQGWSLSYVKGLGY